MGRMVEGGGDEAPRSERVQVAPGWELEECGAGNAEERVWLYRSEPGTVKIAIVHDGRSVMRVVPCAVLTHVLRVCERDAEIDDAELDVGFGCMMVSERA